MASRGEERGRRIILDSGALGVVIGLILVYFLLSTICSLLQEMIEAFIGRRADYLEAGIADLVGPTLTRALFAHPLTQSLASDKGPPGIGSWLSRMLSAPARWLRSLRDDSAQQKRPSYLSATTFSKNLLSVFADGSAVLSADIDDVVGSCLVASSIGLPTVAGFEVQIDNEIMGVTSIEGATWTVDRGRRNTSPAKHKKGAGLTRFRVGPATSGGVERIRNILDELVEGSVKARLLSTLDDVADDVGEWRKDLEARFNEKMDRVSGWYKRRTKLWLFGIGLALVVVMNADTATIARTLWKDQTLRDSMVNAASQVVSADQSSGASGTDPCPVQPSSPADPVGTPSTEASPVPRASLQCLQQSLDGVRSLGLPIGWPSWHWSQWSSTFADDQRVPHNATEVWAKLAGLLLTALALSLGAPFWFGLLNRVTNMRSSGAPPPPATP